mmetsp:Transcript_60945/g.199536  ORF Transcript_60945/g.199536 Transcript_60945/m.199536 type:complete len:266 (+) Transcript_60945:385-1182(+)
MLYASKCSSAALFSSLASLAAAYSGSNAARASMPLCTVSLAACSAAFAVSLAAAAELCKAVDASKRAIASATISACCWEAGAASSTTLANSATFTPKVLPSCSSTMASKAPRSEAGFVQTPRKALIKDLSKVNSFNSGSRAWWCCSQSCASTIARKCTWMPFSRVSLLCCACTMAASPTRCASCRSSSCLLARLAAAVASEYVAVVACASCADSARSLSAFASIACKSALWLSVPPTLVASESTASRSLAWTPNTTSPTIDTMLA